ATGRAGLSRLSSPAFKPIHANPTFLFDGMRRGKPAACSRTSLATAPPPHAVRTDSAIWAWAGGMGPATLKVWAIGAGEAKRYGENGSLVEGGCRRRARAPARLVENSRLAASLPRLVGPSLGRRHPRRV